MYTIGEVLNRLKDEFDDITISKIRFLESEGLIHPDRTDSGYRKFTDDDVERLRYVLRTQRDRYLPLRVIKEELDRLDAGEPIEVPLPPVEGTPAAQALAPDRTVHPPPPDGVSLMDAAPAEVELTLSELCDATGLETADVRALRDHGLIRGDSSFDGDDLQAARAAAELMQLGLEPRHLRMYRQFADREVALYEQLVTPLLKQRNPDARATAASQVEELLRHGHRVHRALLARELRTLLRS
ncbi:MAG: MerR family transcriptional regulator [Actinomycetota bacterium]|nr:MerR family transcriptional regulator [Actinomycetota bacterium]